MARGICRLSITLALLLFALTPFYEVMAELQVDEESCEGRSSMLMRELLLHEVVRIGTAGSGAMDWWKNHFLDPEADKYDKWRISDAIDAFFGKPIVSEVGLAPERITEQARKRTRELRGMTRHATS